MKIMKNPTTALAALLLSACYTGLEPESQTYYRSEPAMPEAEAAFVLAVCEALAPGHVEGDDQNLEDIVYEAESAAKRIFPRRWVLVRQQRRDGNVVEAVPVAEIESGGNCE